MNTDIDDLWRLYTREWVIVHTITMPGSDARPAFLACREWMKTNLEGRVRENDMQIQLNTDGGTLFWAHAMVYKDNLKGEFKHFHTAEVHAKTTGMQEYVIVPRNSPADHDIRSYGVKML